MTFVDPAEMEPPQYPTDHEREATYFDLSHAIGQLDLIVNDHDVSVGDLADLLRVIRDAKRNLSDVERAVENRLGAEMHAYRETIEGVGTIERHARKSRTEWDKEALLRDVLDSRLFDMTSGEIVDETPLEKVLYVWNLPAPRTTALRERGQLERDEETGELKPVGIDPDEYCHVEDKGGFTIKLTTT